MPFTLPDGYSELPESYELKGGDIVFVRVQCKYNYLWTKAIIASFAEEQIKKDGRYEILSINYNDDPDYFWFKLQRLNVVSPDFIGPLGPYDTVAKEEVQLSSVASLALAFTKIVVVGMTIFFLPKVFGSIRDIFVSNEVLFEEAKADTAIAQQGGLGDQVKKAGIGLAIPIIAGAILIYVFSRRK